MTRRFTVLLACALLLGGCADDDGAGTTASTAVSPPTALSTTTTTTEAPAPTIGSPTDEFVEVTGPDGILAGTLTIPTGQGPFPVVVLVSGSGPQDRNETLGRHQPFLDIATHLAGRGIAVLRYDDRGFGESTGEFAGALTMDFAADAAAAVEFVSTDDRFDPNRVGLIGHSEGGLVGPIVATLTDELDFVALLAGPAVSGADVLSDQQNEIMVAEGVPDDLRLWQLEWIEPIIAAAASDMPDAELEQLIRDTIAAVTESRPDEVSELEMEAAAPTMVATFVDPWMRAFLADDPRPELVALSIPTLAVFAGLDVQVSPALNEQPMRDALAGNPAADVVVLDGLNHLFLEAETGAISEYERLPGPVAPSLLDLLVGWIGAL